MKRFRRKLHTFFHTPNILLKKFVGSPFMKILPDKCALKLIYKSTFGKKLNLKNPQTFNEKLHWLKLYNRRPECTKMVDKYAAKKYVADIIGEEYIIPTLGVWEKFDDIDFDALPNQFVLKCTHSSGDVIICKDKNTFDFEAACKKLTKSLKTNYYLISREWPYKSVKPKIIAEQYLFAEDNQLNDYKFFCFNGVCRCFKIDYNRFTKHQANYYDNNKELLPFGEKQFPPDFTKEILMPSCLDEMMHLAEKLAKNQMFLRVDFYEVKGKIYFGELTFFPGGGCSIFTSDEWDKRLGEWLQLPSQIDKLKKEQKDVAFYK